MQETLSTLVCDKITIEGLSATETGQNRESLGVTWEAFILSISKE